MSAPLVYILDEDLASVSIIAGLRAKGLVVKTVPEEFGKGCQDVDWLPKAGQRGYVVLTKDKSMRRTPMEVAVLRDARVRYFALTRGNLTPAQMLAAILAALPQIEGIVRSRRGRGTVLARITVAGKVNVSAAWA